MNRLQKILYPLTVGLLAGIPFFSMAALIQLNIASNLPPIIIPFLVAVPTILLHTVVRRFVPLNFEQNTEIPYLVVIILTAQTISRLEQRINQLETLLEHATRHHEVTDEME